jgi:WD40 repeat protein
VLSVAFSPDGKAIASGGWDKTIKLWDVALGVELRTLSGHAEWVFSVAFSPDGRTLASGSADKTIKLWDVGTGTELQSLLILGPDQGAVPPLVAFSPDGGKLAYSSGKDIFIYDFHARDEQVAQWLKEAGVPVPASAEAGTHPSSP